MITCHHISARVGGRLLFSDLSLSIRPGELLCLLGPNGAGKSTLMHLLAGDHPPASGELRVSGTPMARWSPEALARARAVVTQHATLTFPFRVLEVVLMGRAPYSDGYETRRDLSIARDALARVGLAGFDDRIYPTLSGGEKQRVHLARALCQLDAGSARAERYLLLDEPTSSLDHAHQHGVLRIALELATEGVGVFVILHDLNLAAQYAHRIALLARGRILAEGTPTEALTAARIQEAFGIDVEVTAHPGRRGPLLIPIDEPLTTPSAPVLHRAADHRPT